jgi:hypothetical protein
MESVLLLLLLPLPLPLLLLLPLLTLDPLCLSVLQVDVSSLPTLREGEEFTDANGQPPEATASTRPQVCMSAALAPFLGCCLSLQQH